MKTFKIEQDGHTWIFPASAVADNRAKYYAENDPDTTYAEEFEFTMSDNFELRDWFLNNMNFSDVASGATYIPAVAISEPDVFDEETEITIQE
jgi:hypothetical protein